MAQGKNNRLLNLFLIVIGIIGFVIYIALATHPGRVFRNESDAMLPNYFAGQYVTVVAIEPGKLQRGDVIVFHNPDFPSEDFLKRLIGMPGERVEIKQGKLWINEEPIQESYEIIANEPTYDFGPVDVEQDEFFVLGDNRPNSKDSRIIGPIPAELVVGIVKFTWWENLLNGSL